MEIFTVNTNRTECLAVINGSKPRIRTFRGEDITDVRGLEVKSHHMRRIDQVIH
jgi:hypothetical protein